MLADRMVAGAVGALGVCVIAEATTFDMRAVAGPWLVPLLVGILLLGLGAWGAVKPERGRAAWVPLGRVPLAITAGVLCAYLFLVPVVGFLAATIVMCVGLSMPGPLSARMRITASLSGIVAAVGLYLLFVHVFNVPLPGPVWTSNGV